VLPKNNRLNRSDFDIVFKQGRRVRGKTFSLIVLPAKNKNAPNKIGIIVTKKAYKKAVDRNKLKRQVRNTVHRYILESLPTGQKIIVMAFPVPKPRKYQELKEELVALFSKG